jgi:hypothetical protein
MFFSLVLGKKQVLPGLEPGLPGSKPGVLTNYTIEPTYNGELPGSVPESGLLTHLVPCTAPG